MRSPHRWRAVTLWTFALSLAVLPIDVVAQTAEPVRASTGMVVSQHWLASEVGRDVLAAGGNAIDAAIATGFALAVVHPTAGNIGGGGFMVVRFPNGQTTAIDFREKAPLASFPEMWLDEKGEYSSDVHHRSAKSVGVPGTVAGFERAHKLYGDMDWQRLVSPAVAIAEDGFELSESLARSLAGFLERRARTPATVAQFSKDGTPYAEGETLRQPDLARTLRRIQGEGRDGFYRGETARLITEEMQRGDGIITRADLELYEARERSTIHGSYRGYEIISMPPPSSGGVAMVTMLNILEGFDLASLGHNSAPYIHLVSEAMRRAFRDRAHYLADADFVDVPVHELTSKAHGSKLRASIAADRASVSEPSDITMGYESPETTHYSVVDGNGMAVSVTYTLESGYGSGIVVSGGGFLLNNEMGDFNAGPGLTDDSGLIGTPANLARPQKRMLSSMTPSIVARDGRLVAVVGSPGGRTIINTVAQVILNVIDFGMNIQMAVNAPRIHHQWLPDRISIEGGGASAATVERLEAMGHTVRMGGGQGSANSIMIDPRTRDRLGAADPRRSDAGARGH
ncbi:MAG: gamma-glutamyltransferase [Gemmatimonadota bacterium]|nr:gamma-glutamyltransferase [Gemmatimonadota bacterium]|tara:strand:- start:708 stop:2417 length:1710 start_codon:yes stop_codon:yes gene_type:complete